MPWIPPGVNPNILAAISPEQWNAWADGADIGPAPHTLEQAASSTDQPTSKPTSTSTSTSTSGTIVEATRATNDDVPYIFAFANDYTWGADNLHFKKGMQGQVLEEKEMGHGKSIAKIVKIQVKGVTYGYDKSDDGVWVPMEWLEKGKVVAGDGEKAGTK